MGGAYLWIALVVLGCREATTPGAPPAEQAPPTEQAVPTEQAPLLTIEVLKGEAEERPAVVAIHGLGDRPERFAGAFRGYEAPVRLLLPRAPHPYGDGYSWMDAPRSDVDAYSAAIRASADHVADTIAALGLDRPVITGFSQGGMLSFAVAVLHPEAVSLAVPVSGWLPEPLWPDEKGDVPPIAALHGDADEVLPLGPTRLGVEHLRSLGIDARIEVYPGVGHSIPPQVRADWYRLLAEGSSRR